MEWYNTICMLFFLDWRNADAKAMQIIKITML